MDSRVRLDDAADALPVDGSADRVARFGTPLGVGVERNRNHQPPTTAIGDDDVELLRAHP